MQHGIRSRGKACGLTGMKYLTSTIKPKRTRDGRNDKSRLPRHVSFEAYGHMPIQTPAALDEFLRQPICARGEEDEADVADRTPPICVSGRRNRSSRQPRIVETNV